MRRILNGRTKLVGLLTAIGLMVVLAAGAAVAQPEPPTITCTGGVCLGTEGPDLILGTNGYDVILARGGADGVNAQGGNDIVLGGPGDDSPGGSPSGHDPEYHLEGGFGNDRVLGQAGKDSVTDVYGPFRGFPSARDQLFGGLNKDFLNGQDGDNRDYLDRGSGVDDFYIADPGDTVLNNCETNIG